uniref:Uncharacterized protein n=1 Tax=Myripristis murdjan TaxID=586833 RepID=A0A667Z4H0_9TELE
KLQRKEAHMDCFVDNLNEDEAERESLLAKPTCFIIVGKPVTYLFLSHTQKKLLDILSEGKSIPEDMVFQLIIARLNSPDVEHYGYVLSCLPFMSEACLKIHEQIDLIKNLRLTPDFIINIKCPDKDLIQRLSGVRKHPETGQSYLREQWSIEKVDKRKKEEIREEDPVEAEEEQELHNDMINQMVWLPENSTENTSLSISMYKETTLRSLEVSFFGHPMQSLCLFQEEHLRAMSSAKAVAPGFRWRRSCWGSTCPVALKEGIVIQGKPELCVGFQDKIYVLSSEEAYQKFLLNPRQYLLSPMPRPPCKVSIIGPPQSGKSTLCKLLAQHYGAVVIDVEELIQPLMAKLEQDRLDKIKEDATQTAIGKIKMKMEMEIGSTRNLGKLSLVWIAFLCVLFTLDSLCYIFFCTQKIHQCISMQYCFPCSVTEDHPEVKAMVLNALREAKEVHPAAPSELYAEVLEKCIKEVCQISEACWLHLQA